ncbi:uncharacterized protein LOC111089507 [Limulus polyphemus]|uniref:Uncharacterized protein LOC111089507 n=1 Tax=Limulus polyphemus TaxID=6850 RepID=A0ABM1TPP2_LIMPO|nr:uncharacterized protein LOC111089507 [Limulus polyphemus]
MGEKTKLLKHQDSDELKYGSIKDQDTDSRHSRTHFTRHHCVIVSTTLVIVLVSIIITLSLGLPKIREKKLKYLDTSFPVSSSILGVYDKAVILADAEPCAPIGKYVQ